MSQDYVRNKVNQLIEECELHVKRIDYSYNKLSKLLPLDKKKYKNLDDEQVESLDQFLFRFCKLQDAIGQRFFPALLELLNEPVKTKPFLDRLNRLEQLGVIDSKTRWLQLREIRNELSHEYENEPDSMSQAINHIYDAKDILIDVFNKVKHYSKPYLE